MLLLRTFLSSFFCHIKSVSYSVNSPQSGGMDNRNETDTMGARSLEPTVDSQIPDEQNPFDDLLEILVEPLDPLMSPLPQDMIDMYLMRMDDDLPEVGDDFLDHINNDDDNQDYGNFSQSQGPPASTSSASLQNVQPIQHNGPVQNQNTPPRPFPPAPFAIAATAGEVLHWRHGILVNIPPSNEVISLFIPATLLG